MSDTPRTEAEVNRQKCWSDDIITIDANFACQLERELNAANDRIKRLEKHIELLKALGDELDLEVYAPAPNCSCHISPPCNDCTEHWNIRELKAGWKAAKEAKP